MNDFENAISIESPLRREWNMGHNMNEVENK